MKKKLLLRTLAGFLSVFMLFGIFSATDIVAIAEEIQTESFKFEIPKTEDELKDLLSREYPNEQNNTPAPASNEVNSAQTRSTPNFETTDGKMFYIRNKVSGKYLTANGAQVIQSEHKSTEDQRWRFYNVNPSYNGKGYFKLSPLSSPDKKMLHIQSNETANGAVLDLYENGEYGTEFFKFKAMPDGSYQIITAFTFDTQCITNFWGNTDSGQTLCMWDISTTQSQIDDQSWFLEPAGPERQASSYLKNKVSGKYLDTLNSKNDSGSDVGQWEYTGLDNQRWRFYSVNEAFRGKGYFRLSPAHSPDKKALDIKSNQTENGASLGLYEYGDYGSEFFKFKPMPDGSYQILTALTWDRQCITNFWGNTASGKTLCMWDVSSTPSQINDQSWFLEPPEKGDEVSATPKNGMPYRIRARHSGQLWGLSADGATVSQGFNDLSNSQVFNLEAVPNEPGYFYIHPDSALDKVLQLSTSTSGGYRKVESYCKTGNDLQKFRFIKNPNGSFQINPKTLPLYSIAVTQNQYTNGSVVTAAPYTSEDNQQWIFDDAFDRENVTIEPAKAAMFENQEIVPVETQSQMTAQFNKPSLLLFNPSTHRMGGFLEFKNGNESISYFLMMDIAQSHMDITGQRSIIGSREMSPIDGYELTCFRIEEKCSTMTLMKPNYGIEGKLLISIGLLQKSTNKMFYTQTEITGMPFDYLYDNAWSKDNEYGFEKPAATRAGGTDLTTGLAQDREKSYLFLKKANGFQDQTSDAPPVQSNPKSASNVFTIDPNSPESIDNEEINNDGSGMRDLLGILGKENEIDIDSLEAGAYNDLVPADTTRNGQPALSNERSSSFISRVEDFEFKWQLNYRFKGVWGGFKRTDSIMDQEHPYYYTKITFPFGGTQSTVTSIIFLDILMDVTDSDMWDGILSKDLVTLGVYVKANMDIIHDQTKNTLTKYDSNGNLIVKEAHLIQSIITPENARFNQGRVEHKASTERWSVVGDMSQWIGAAASITLNPYVGIAATVFEAAGLFEEWTNNYFLKDKIEKLSDDGLFTAQYHIFKNIWKPANLDHEIWEPPYDSQGDYVLLQGRVDTSGDYLFNNFFRFVTKVRNWQKYPEYPE